MCTISEMVCFLILLILSVQDIRIRKVSKYVLAAAGILCIFCQIAKKETDEWVLLGGLAVGVLFMFISWITKEGIGYGDSMGILVLGGFLGLWEVLFVLSIAFFLLICALIPILLRRRFSRRCTLPFYPFLTGGYLCLLLTGGIHI